MSLHVDRSGSGADLVLLHGWGLHSGAWDEVAPLLARRFRVHAIDLPGHGLSAAMPGASFEEAAEAVAEAAERTRRQRPGLDRLGRLGHLANDTAADILGACLHGAMRHVVAAHLSEQNNSPELVRQALAEATGAPGHEFVVADAADGFDWLSLR